MQSLLLKAMKFAPLGAAFSASRVLAADPPPPPPPPVQQGANAARDVSQPTDLFTATGVFHTISTVLIFIVGAVAVIMLIVGGLRYVISQGDSAAVKQAKDTILYAIIGIVVAIMAYAIVNFVAKNI